MWKKVEKFFKEGYTLYQKVFHKTPTGRTCLRIWKTFWYAFIGSYVALKVAPFQVDWVIVFETALLTSLGYGADKGIREYGAVEAKTKKKK